MLIQNWPTAFVLVVLMISVVIIFINLIDRQKPVSRHCSRCLKDIEEEQRRSFREANGISEPDE